MHKLHMCLHQNTDYIPRDVIFLRYECFEQLFLEAALQCALHTHPYASTEGSVKAKSLAEL